MSCWTKPELENMLEDVVNELDLSEIAIEKHGPLGTPPAELVRLVLEQKDRQIQMLKSGMVQLPSLQPAQDGYSRGQVEQYGKDILLSISQTFLDKNNIDKADKESDKDVFQAIGETILNFPLPCLPAPSAQVSEAVDGWVTQKPKADHEFTFVTKQGMDGCWNYEIWQVILLNGEEGKYYGLVTGDGEEWGDYEDLVANFYKII